VVICGDKERIKGDALTNLAVIERMGVAIERMDMDGGRILSQVGKFTSGCEMVVDAIFGTGLQGELRGEYPELITCLNSCGVEIVAVDIPSGLDCDTGLPLPICTEATVTVTFAAVKKGFVACPDALAATGKVFVASIGVGSGP
jgi:NAD(P)H-hydrate epimerase